MNFYDLWMKFIKKITKSKIHLFGLFAINLSRKKIRECIVTFNKKLKSKIFRLFPQVDINLKESYNYIKLLEHNSHSDDFAEKEFYLLNFLNIMKILKIIRIIIKLNQKDK